MPGLIDAHVHLAIGSVDRNDLSSWTASYGAARALDAASRMLSRGFTSVRDVGGADAGIARALDEGIVSGPRVVFAGRMLSQTGGHGDERMVSEESRAAVGRPPFEMSVLVDSPDEVRRAAREQLRQGASLIKMAVSGGVASPRDRIDSVQFTEEEVHAAVVEAGHAGTYVTVHAYHPRAIAMAIRAGVTCVEHANLLDEQTAHMMRDAGTSLVPTLVTYELLASHGVRSGLPPQSMAKVDMVRKAGIHAYSLALASEVPVAFGTDLLAGMEVAQSREFAIRAKVADSAEIVREATVNAGRLLRLPHPVGVLERGAYADFIIVRGGNPLENVAILAEPDRVISQVIKGGSVMPSR